jgi:RimJ/RimL family protein N-acetyltransferase
MPELPEDLRLEGESIVLRPWHDEDAPALEPVCGEWNVCSFTSVPWDYSEAEAVAWIERGRHKREAGGVLPLAVVERDGDLSAGHDDGLPVGHVNLVGFGADGREAAIGYWLVPAARGRGLATAACGLLIDWGFDQLGLERIEFAILPDNAASRHVAERLGATAEGLRRDSHEAHGRRWDMAIYSVGR